MKSLIIWLCGIGDVILLARAIEATRKKNPNHEFYFITKQPAADLANNLKCFNKVYEVSSYDEIFKSVDSIFNSGVQFDHIYPFSPLDLDAVSGHHIFDSKLINENKWFSVLMDIHKMKNDHHEGKIHISNLILKVLGGGDSIQPSVKFKEKNTHLKVLAEINRIKSQFHYVIGVNPGSNWRSKRWPITSFVNVISNLNDIDYGVVVLGSEKDRLDYHCALSASNVLDLSGLYEASDIPNIVNELDCLVSGDTGVMHIADSLSIPLLALFGPTSPHEYGPLGRNSNVIQSNEKCAPCFSEKCEKLGTEPECLKAIKPELVVKIVKDLIGHE